MKKVEFYKVGRLEFYICMPLKSLRKKAKHILERFLNRVFKRWYCDGCGKYHSGRVVAYYPCDICDGVCFRHIITPEEIMKCESIILGGKNITNRIKSDIEGQSKRG